MQKVLYGAQKCNPSWLVEPSTTVLCPLDELLVPLWCDWAMTTASALQLLQAC